MGTVIYIDIIDLEIFTRSNTDHEEDGYRISSDFSNGHRINGAACLIQDKQRWRKCVRHVIGPQLALDLKLISLTYLALRSSSPCQDNGQQEFAICACL